MPNKLNKLKIKMINEHILDIDIDFFNLSLIKFKPATTTNIFFSHNHKRLRR